ncbi:MULTISPECIES: hypothetical protein [Roseicyclus]|jgi:hypothetical protein|nr:hypothetical protein [Roseicyclus sp. Amp-Y-6]
MTEQTEDKGPSQTDRLRGWLKSDVTVTLPGWAVALGGVAAVVLLLVALD